ncbi:hypothetical protein H6F67_02725 [Microcoleus sp. FACHB-1515]|uniref:hypothetical protein n=1 Tax=Cyanophyceae TaxID=3028117 RepID=UPI0016842AD5|nr:hypothetical protein [Microcoleus sp. FACHB-1515]MBD2088776.1 hypothetical protein [Microcoleus sp. FACHB-1515]
MDEQKMRSDVFRNFCLNLRMFLLQNCYPTAAFSFGAIEPSSADKPSHCWIKALMKQRDIPTKIDTIAFLKYSIITNSFGTTVLQNWENKPKPIKSALLTSPSQFG